MSIRIVAKQDGYCRCNTLFSAAGAVYPDGAFDPRQLQILRADPNLAVLPVSAPGEKDADEPDRDYDKMTVAQLTEELSERGVEIPANARKQALIALLTAQEG